MLFSQVPDVPHALRQHARAHPSPGRTLCGWWRERLQLASGWHVRFYCLDNNAFRDMASRSQKNLNMNLSPVAAVRIVHSSPPSRRRPLHTPAGLRCRNHSSDASGWAARGGPEHSASKLLDNTPALTCRWQLNTRSSMPIDHHNTPPRRVHQGMWRSVKRQPHLLALLPRRLRRPWILDVHRRAARRRCNRSTDPASNQMRHSGADRHLSLALI